MYVRACVCTGLSTDATVQSYSSLADGDPLFDSTVLTHHVAAPVESTVTPLDASLSHDVVPATATQRATAIHAFAGPVALSSRRARDVFGRVPFAEVGRLLIVEQVERQIARPSLLGSFFARFIPGRPFAFLLQQQQRRTVAQVRLVDHDRRPEAFLQHGADHPEVWSRFPTGLQLTAARHAMTLASNLHVRRYSLQHKQ